MNINEQHRRKDKQNKHTQIKTYANTQRNTHGHIHIHIHTYTDMHTYADLAMTPKRNSWSVCLPADLANITSIMIVHYDYY